MNPALVYLTQTETTAGFLSQNSEALCAIKTRPQGKSFLLSVDSLVTLRSFTRVPKAHKHLVRKAKKTTFAYPCGLAIRVVKDEAHLQFLRKLTWSTLPLQTLVAKGLIKSLPKKKPMPLFLHVKTFLKINPQQFLN